MEILVTLKTDTQGLGTEIVMDVRARRLLNENKSNKSYYAVDGRNTIVREFVIELDDYSDEDVKEYEAKHHNTPRKPKFRN